MSLLVEVLDSDLSVESTTSVTTLVGEASVTLAVAVMGPAGPKGDEGEAGPPGATDHGALAGLADDDHAQYLLASGARAMTGALAMGGNAITGVGTVDGRDVSADGAALDAHVAASNPHAGSLGTAHEGAGGAVHAVAVASGAAGFMSGADKAKLDGVAAGATATPLASTTPAAVGSAAVGVATSAARADHVHAHGDQAGGSLHSTATSSVAGFMSAADKSKLDGVAASATATPLSSATPAAVGVAAAGVATTASRGDHVHAHGDQAGGSLHAVAIASGAAGFMSGADKAKLDGVAANADVTPLSSTTPAAVGVAAVGVGTTVARADHVHAHGDQAGGSLHAAATTSVAGFMSSADKTKLDGVAAGATATPLASTTPAAIGTAAVGVGTTAARADHVHAHGNLAGGTLHSTAVASGAAGFMSGADKAKLDGIEALADVTDAANVNAAGAVMESDFAATHTILMRQSGATPVAVAIPLSTFVGRIASGDIIPMTVAQAKTLLGYAASEVAFTPDGDIAASNAQAAIVEVRNDTDTKLGTKASIAGQLGGTGASPTVLGVRETGGPTLLMFGAIADGELVGRVGAELVGVAPGGGGGVPTGGTTGQVLAKASAADYDTEWIDVSTTSNVDGGAPGDIYPAFSIDGGIP